MLDFEHGFAHRLKGRDARILVGDQRDDDEAPTWRYFARRADITTPDQLLRAHHRGNPPRPVDLALFTIAGECDAGERGVGERGRGRGEGDGAGRPSARHAPLTHLRGVAAAREVENPPYTPRHVRPAICQGQLLRRALGA